MEKKELRKLVLDRRELLASEKINKLITDRFLMWQVYSDSSTVMLTSSFGSEIRTDQIIQKALSAGKTVVLPVCETKTHRMILRRISDFPGELELSAYGILEPVASCREMAPSDLDLVLVPGMAFETSGMRLGYGGGYYDRFLPAVSCPTVGLVREDFIYESLPTDSHDLPVDFLITDQRIIDCRARG